ncbi:hypothetical protein RND71_018233 [Anisodus tanguticus]|uniref:ABCC10-like N-terminal domain-containing protein n=1 Tax=Anisodus tanguticus TaxID=243964 RepID=A0AAE1VBW3_9SOLA|nr:hypothetical protein RND71_018233 [Anisodus tanguticus]
MLDLWAVFCGASDCLKENGKTCSTDWVSMTQPSSCINHALIIYFDVILLLLFLFSLFSILDKEVTMKIALDVLSFVGACLLLLCTYKGLQHDEERDQNDLYAPLNAADSGISKSDSVSSVTPFAKAGIINIMSFWWMNPLMKKGK